MTPLDPRVTQVREAVLAMMRAVKFDEENHVYTRVEDGRWLAGVSTISSILPKPWLASWGAKEAVKALGYSDYEDLTKASEMLARIRACKNVKEYVEILKEAKGACRKKSSDALVDGKEGHRWLETLVKARMRGSELPKMPKGMLERPLTQFLAWERLNVKEWVLSEARVADVENGFAGTLDSMFIDVENRLCVGDYKFAQHMSDEHGLQTAGYCIPFEKYGIAVDRRVIIRLPKTLTREEYDKKTHKYSVVPNDIEVKDVATPYVFDRETFLAARKLQTWINFVSPKE